MSATQLNNGFIIGGFGQDHSGDGTSLSITPEEEREREIRDQRKAIESAGWRLSQLVERRQSGGKDLRREELLSEKRAAKARLKELGADRR
jgi:hypothetical protein